MSLLAWHSLSLRFNCFSTGIGIIFSQFFNMLFSVFDLFINLKHSTEKSFIKSFKKLFLQNGFPQLKNFITMLPKPYKEFTHYPSVGKWPTGKALVRIVA